MTIRKIISIQKQVPVQKPVPKPAPQEPVKPTTVDSLCLQTPQNPVVTSFTQFPEIKTLSDGLFGLNEDSPFRVSIDNGSMVWQSLRVIVGEDIPPILDFLKKYGRKVIINSGTHGDEKGNSVLTNPTLSEGLFTLRDLVRYGYMENVAINPLKFADAQPFRAPSRLDTKFFDAPRGELQIGADSKPSTTQPVYVDYIDGFCFSLKSAQLLKQIAEKALLEAAEPKIDIPPSLTDFVGQTSYMETLERLFSNPGTSERAYVTGLGGTGKSRLALAVVERLKENYGFVIWVDGSEGMIDVAIDTLDFLGIDTNGLSDKRILKKFKQVMERLDKPWLLIIDNVPEDMTIKKDLPRKGHILVTTRAHKGKSAVHLTKMSPEDSVLLLRASISLDQGDDEKLSLLAETLGYHPLAMIQARAFIGQDSGLTVDAYITMFKTQVIELLGEAKAEDHEESVIKTLMLTLDKIKEKSPLGLFLIQQLAFLKSDILLDPHARVLAFSFVRDLNPTMEPDALMSKFNLEYSKAKRLLLEYSLIDDKGRGVFAMHDLMQSICRSQQDKDAKIAILDRHMLILGMLSSGLKEVKHTALQRMVIRHGLTVSPQLRALNEKTIETANKLHDMASYLTVVRFFDMAERAYREAAAHLEDVPNKAYVANVLREQGWMLHKNEKTEEGVQLLEKAISLFRTIYDKSHWEIGLCQLRLATIYVEQSKFDKAIALLGEAQPIFDGISTGDESRVSHYAPDGDYLKKFMADPVGMTMAMKPGESFKMTVKTLDGTVERGMCLRLLGACHYGKGEEQKGKAYTQDAIDMFTDMRKKPVPNVLGSESKQDDKFKLEFALTLTQAGFWAFRFKNVDNAKMLLEMALSYFDQLPQDVMVWSKKALTCQMLGQLYLQVDSATSIKYLRLAIETYDALFEGNDDQEELYVNTHLLSAQLVLPENGSLEEGIQLARRALKLAKKFDEGNVPLCYLNLANGLYNNGQLAEALELMKESFDQYESQNGVGFYLTGSRMLGDQLRNERKYDEALACYQNMLRLLLSKGELQSPILVTVLTSIHTILRERDGLTPHTVAFGWFSKLMEQSIGLNPMMPQSQIASMRRISNVPELAGAPEAEPGAESSASATAGSQPASAHAAPEASPHSAADGEPSASASEQPDPQAASKTQEEPGEAVTAAASASASASEQPDPQAASKTQEEPGEAVTAAAIEDAERRFVMSRQHEPDSKASYMAAKNALKELAGFYKDNGDIDNMLLCYDICILVIELKGGSSQLHQTTQQVPPGYVKQKASLLNTMGLAYHRMGNTRVAIALLNQALELCNRFLEPGNKSAGQIRSNIERISQ